jgi:hypothetical protein
MLIMSTIPVKKSRSFEKFGGSFIKKGNVHKSLRYIVKYYDELVDMLKNLGHLDRQINTETTSELFSESDVLKRYNKIKENILVVDDVKARKAFQDTFSNIRGAFTNRFGNDLEQICENIVVLRSHVEELCAGSAQEQDVLESKKKEIDVCVKKIAQCTDDLEDHKRNLKKAKNQKIVVGMNVRAELAELGKNVEDCIRKQQVSKSLREREERLKKDGREYLDALEKGGREYKDLLEKICECASQSIEAINKHFASAAFDFHRCLNENLKLKKGITQKDVILYVRKSGKPKISGLSSFKQADFEKYMLGGSVKKYRDERHKYVERAKKVYNDRAGYKDPGEIGDSIREQLKHCTTLLGECWGSDDAAKLPDSTSFDFESSFSVDRFKV